MIDDLIKVITCSDILQPKKRLKLDTNILSYSHLYNNMDIPLSTLFHRALITASKAYALPTIQDETQVCTTSFPPSSLSYSTTISLLTHTETNRTSSNPPSPTSAPFSRASPRSPSSAPTKPSRTSPRGTLFTCLFPTCLQT